MRDDSTDIVVNARCRIPLSELTFRFSRSAGPGGQNVNVRDTRVELLFDAAGSPSLSESQRRHVLHKLSSRTDSRGTLRVVASRARTQAANRALVLERFAHLMADALRVEKPRRPTRPSKAATQRRLDEKKKTSRRKRERAWRPDPS